MPKRRYDMLSPVCYFRKLFSSMELRNMTHGENSDVLAL
ncbi:hypothetical protein VN12_01105 [Pirellula sp. SH-Sr6A]|nr:hypothetical protein VN12_01105 [Pirellula sp. SH-Sr6A]